MDYWKLYIEQMSQIISEVEKHDKEGMWNYYPPNKPAAVEQIIEFEKNIGFELDLEYKKFLESSNGWKAFYQNVDLFGTGDYKDYNKMKYMSEIFQEIDSEIKENIFPIGVSTEDIDLFAIVKTNCVDEGKIIWFAGGEIERFKNFKVFFEEMMVYNKREIELL